MSVPNQSNKSGNKIGVIDLGTNTFHLLIASYDDQGWHEVQRLRRFVALGEEGIDTLGEQALARAYSALQEFKDILLQQEVKMYQVHGTAALRTASNGAQFIKQVKENLEMNIQIIGGDQEALLIYEGVRQAITDMKSPHLIMDIGGGSVEFIIGDQQRLLWAQSFPIGVAVLYQRFHHSDPIRASEIKDTEDYLQSVFQSIREALRKYPCENLIGASGTFDVLERLLPAEPVGDHAAKISVSDFYPLYNEFIQSDLAARMNWPGLPAQRAQLIIVALILINQAITLQPFQNIYISKFAMKEGMIAQLLKKVRHA